MSTYATRERPGQIPVETIQEWIGHTETASATAFGPARALVDTSEARTIAIDLQAALRQSGDLYREALQQREKLESDRDTKPEVLRARRQEYQAEWTERRQELERQIKTQSEELRAALAREALPVSPDPNAVLVARQEIEMAIRVAGRNQESPMLAMTRLAERGGEVASVAASEWGRLALRNATGDDLGFDNVRDSAIKSSLESDDEVRRRAAAALKALDTNRPGTTGSALNEAHVKAVTVLKEGGKLLTTPQPLS